MGSDGIWERVNRTQSGTAGGERMFSVTGIQLRSPTRQQITLRYFKDDIIVQCRLVKGGTRKTLKIVLIIIYKITSITRKFSSTTRDEIDI